MKILSFRTDKLGDFILTKKCLNPYLSNGNNFIINFVVSESIKKYCTYFSSINKTYVFKKNFFFFLLNNKNILKKNYDYIIVFDGKRRSILTSLLLKGKKIFFVKSFFLYNVLSYLGYICYYNSIKKIQLQNYNIINKHLKRQSKLLPEKKFYFDYTFEKFNNQNLLKNKITFFHLDEKWFQKYYIKNFNYFEWDFSVFERFLNILTKKKLFKQLVITTGPIKNIQFIKSIKKEKFFRFNNYFYIHKKYKKKVILIDNLSFRQLETLLKDHCNLFICNEGGISHVTSNLNIKTYAYVQGDSEFKYKHWTGHMKNIKLILRPNTNKKFLDSLNKI